MVVVVVPAVVVVDMPTILSVLHVTMSLVGLRMTLSALCIRCDPIFITGIILSLEQL